MITDKLKRLPMSLNSIYFLIVIIIAITAVAGIAIQAYRDGEWIRFTISAGVALMIAWDYLTDWAHKIK